MTSALCCTLIPTDSKPNGTTTRSLKPGQVLYREGDLLPEVFRVTSGWVKLSRTTLKGQNFIVELLFPGDYFDLSCYWEGGPSSLTATGLNLYPVELIGVNASFSGDPGLMRLMQRQMISRMHQQQETMVALATYSVEDKVMLGLQRLARKGGRTEGGQVTFPLPLTRQELGDWIGTSPESSTRALTDLQRKGVITLLNREVSCGANFLDGLVRPDSSGAYACWQEGMQ